MLSYEKLKEITKTLSDTNVFTIYPFELTYYLPKKLLDKINEDIFYRQNKENKNAVLEYTDIIEIEYKNIKITLKEDENN